MPAEPPRPPMPSPGAGASSANPPGSASAGASSGVRPGGSGTPASHPPAPAAPAPTAAPKPQVNTDKLFEYFDTLLVSYLAQGIDTFLFQPDVALQVGKAGAMQVLDRVLLPAVAVDTFLRRVISVHLTKPFEELDESDIRGSRGGRLAYDVVLETPKGPIARSYRASIIDTNRGLGFKLLQDPLFVLGYDPPADPMAMNDAQLEAFFDDFATRMTKKKDPTPKDVIFSPNKVNPFVTVTGGMKPVEDVLTASGGKITSRLAFLMIRLANSPMVNERIKANGGLLTGLDLDLAYRTRAGRRFRVNIADSFDNELDNGPLITMRVLPEKPWTTSELPLPKVVLETLMNTRMGLVIINGTTGSGKSTTMGVLIDYLLKNKSVNLLTIENPIETMFPSKLYPRSIVSQRELGKHTSSLHRGLESAVRQTLNIAMVGEIRNAEDCSMALELAQSGHLIFATLHAGSVGESIRRMIDMYPADQEKKIREMLAAQYRMGMAQILVKGVSGQTEMVLEVMKTNQEIKLLMMDQQEKERQLSMRELLEYYAERAGTSSLDMALVRLFKEGKISEDCMMFNSPDPDALIYRQSRLGIKISARFDVVGSMIDQDTQDKLQMEKIDSRLRIDERKKV